MKNSITVTALVATAVLARHAVSAQLVVSGVSQPLASLKTLPIPEPENLGEFVKDRDTTIRLGKALFWDMQVGSDGIQACASCHFHAGTDTKAKNQIAPGLLRVNADGSPNPDFVFDTESAPNYTLKPEDYPFHKLQAPNNRSSAVIADSNGDRVAADGAFKTPGLRNIEMTAPYFHNGGQLTLRQVIDFYNRGGDFHEQNIKDLDPDIQNLNLSEQDRDDLVEFLKALTDERVRKEQAPFDHPQLFIPNGHPGDTTSVTNDGTSKATDGNLLEIPAVGRKGGRGTPNFLS